MYMSCMSRSLPRDCQRIFPSEMPLQCSNGGPFSGMRVFGKRSVIDPAGKGARGADGGAGERWEALQGLGGANRVARRRSVFIKNEP